jgi:hypothetical protein
VLDLQQVLRDALSMRGRAGVPEAQELPQDKLCTFDAAREHHAGDHQKCRQELYIKVLECSETQGLGMSESTTLGRIFSLSVPFETSQTPPSLISRKK